MRACLRIRHKAHRWEYSIETFKTIFQQNNYSRLVNPVTNHCLYRDPVEIPRIFINILYHQLCVKRCYRSLDCE